MKVQSEQNIDLDPRPQSIGTPNVKQSNSETLPKTAIKTQQTSLNLRKLSLPYDTDEDKFKDALLHACKDKNLCSNGIMKWINNILPASDEELAIDLICNDPQMKLQFLTLANKHISQGSTEPVAIKLPSNDTIHFDVTQLQNRLCDSQVKEN